ncbi:uncharacterized protein LOC122498437 isoform X1 [Leptopilina heterotoma]|uniref:uncharacterized protein LOC122498437 isoform X1 n=1 Tax=Leptopilina heterotoma TaxID=63436 RepID=UPI001CA936D8|nr:uncharacterized protein LOC122498437 isoform X1 [Leptopilina heterotoma]
MNRIAFQLALLSSLLFPSGFVLWKILQPNQKNDTTSTATKVPKEPSLDNFGIYQYDGDVFIALKGHFHGEPYVTYPVFLVKTSNNKEINIGNISENNLAFEYYINETVEPTYYFKIKACNEAGCSDPLKTKEFVINYEEELPASLKGDIRQKSATNDTCIIEWNSPETFGSLIKYDMTMYNKSNNVLWNGSLLVPHEVVSSHKFQHLQPQNTYDIQLYRQNNRGLSTHPIKGSCTTTP